MLLAVNSVMLHDGETLDLDCTVKSTHEHGVRPSLIS
jgi:hypothetical protein